MSKTIASDNPFSEEQLCKLKALLDTLLPPADDGSRPGAGDMDLVNWLSGRAEELLAPITAVLDGLVEDFDDLELESRVQIVQALSESQPELFQALLFHTYACYYQDDRVLNGIGLPASPPFPRGNSIEEGDLSMLDPVMKRDRGYRKA